MQSEDADDEVESRLDGLINPESDDAVMIEPTLLQFDT